MAVTFNLNTKDKRLIFGWQSPNVSVFFHCLKMGFLFLLRFLLHSKEFITHFHLAVLGGNLYSVLIERLLKRELL